MLLTTIRPLLLSDRFRVSFFTFQHSFIATKTSAGSCAHHTISGAVLLSSAVCHGSLTRKARGSNSPGRTKSSTLWGAALFVLHGFYGAVKDGNSNSPCPALCVPRGRNAPVGRF